MTSRTYWQFAARLTAIVSLVAAPAVAKEPSPVSGRLWLELAGGYRADFSPGRDESAFELDRIELGAAIGWLGWLRAELLVDATRSVADQSQFGVAGNAQVVRVKNAFVGVDLTWSDVALAAAMGVIPHPWFEPGSVLRGAVRPLSEAAAFVDAADLGATVAVRAWQDRLRLDVAVRNGEGFSEIELDAAKNLYVALSSRVWSSTLFDRPASLRLAAAYEDGSLGVGGAANRRVLGTIAFTSARLAVGVEAGHAVGYRGEGDRDATFASAWLTGEPVAGYLGLFARYDYVDTAVDRDAVDTRLTAGLYTDPLAGLGRADLGRARLYLLYRYHDADADALPAAIDAALVPAHAVELRMDLYGLLSLTAPEAP